jgi:hypothetical protein
MMHRRWPAMLLLPRTLLRQPCDWWLGEQRRSFPRLFHQVLRGVTGAHRLDWEPDLACKNDTRQHSVDGSEATHNWLVPDSTRWTRGCSSVGQSRRLITARSQVRGLPAPPSNTSKPQLMAVNREGGGHSHSHSTEGTRPDRSTLGGRPTRRELQGQHEPVRCGRSGPVYGSGGWGFESLAAP